MDTEREQELENGILCSFFVRSVWVPGREGKEQE